MAAGTAPDWRPHRATALALVAAVAMNMATGNRLWLAYSLTGCALLTIVVALVRHGVVRIPPAAAWLGGLSAALHYLGGSMAGVHRIGGVNGMYAAFPWWDNVVHFLGSFAVAVAACTALLGLGRVRAALLGTCVAVTLGTFVELYEFGQFVAFGTVDQGFYTNTLLDLYYNLLGAAAGAALMARSSRQILPLKAQPRQGGKQAGEG